MITRKALCAFVIGAIAASAVHTGAQCVSILDFTTTPIKERKRPPKPFPPGTVLGGRCGGVLGSQSLRVSLTSLDRAEYVVGDEFTYTLRVSNTGNLPIRVPALLSLADIEPEDANISYSYEPMEIWLGLSDPEHHLLSILLLTLYGSNEIPGTQRELQPAEWFEVRGKGVLQATDTTKRTVLADIDTYSNMPIPHMRMEGIHTGVMSWRGDILHFDGKSQHEFHSCRNYEVGTAISNITIALLPNAGK